MPCLLQQLPIAGDDFSGARPGRGSYLEDIALSGVTGPNRFNWLSRSGRHLSATISAAPTWQRVAWRCGGWRRMPCVRTAATRRRSCSLLARSAHDLPLDTRRMQLCNWSCCWQVAFSGDY